MELLHGCVECGQVLLLVGRLRGALPKAHGCGAVYREITLRPLEDGAVRKDPGVAVGTRNVAEFDFPFGSDDILILRHYAIFRYRYLQLLIPLWVPDVPDALTGVICNGGIEHHLAGANPVGRSGQRWSMAVIVPQNDWLLLRQPGHISGRLVPRGIHRIAFVNRTHWDFIVVIDGNVLRRADGVGQRDFVARNFGVIPGPFLAEVEIASNNAEKAIDLLRTTEAYELSSESPMLPVYVRGKAYLNVKQGQAAAAEFKKILDHRGIVGTSPIGALAHLELGRALALSSTISEAREEYQKFFSLWKDADTDIPILKEARSEFTRIAAAQNRR